MVKRFNLRLCIIFFHIFTISVNAQDQIIYLNGEEDYVDKIVEVKNDSLTYITFKKYKKAPLYLVKGYYLTIDTRENMKKGYFRREREYFEIDSIYHAEYYSKKRGEIDPVNEYITSILPDDFSTLNYEKGYYITHSFDTIYTLLSRFDNPEYNNVCCIVRRDSSKYEILTAHSIFAYAIGDQKYLNFFSSPKKEKQAYFFIKLEIDGEMNLYSKPELPFDKGGFFIINKKGLAEFYAVSTEDECCYDDLDGFNIIVISIDSNISSNTFMSVLLALVSDCEMLAMKIKSGFYTKMDIVQIVNEYNKCGATN
ncbi:MAG: hypothetical protein JXB49_01865 [Bacteroidales bacterium]|nr:hypothetical protein [Bacteroidales bacterium]